MKKILSIILIGLLFVAFLGFQGCNQITSGNDTMKPAGFFSGLWHGLILPIRFIASFFMDLDIYASVNNGTGYRVGFIIGVFLLLSGGGTRSIRRKMKKDR